MSTVEKLCYKPVDIDTIRFAPLVGGAFDSMPSVQGVAEDSGDLIKVEVSADDAPFTLCHAVLVDGSFQLPHCCIHITLHFWPFLCIQEEHLQEPTLAVSTTQPIEASSESPSVSYN